MNQVEIYQGQNNETIVEVQFEKETVWLSQEQVSHLFQKAKSTINEHIKHIYEEGELIEKETKRKFGNPDFSDKPTNFYNLDVIISVGYRVNSKRGTQFRQWATQRLKEHLVNGYTLNEKRLKQVLQNMQQLEAAIKKIQQSGNSGQLNLQEATGLLDIITNYTQSFILLNQFDSNSLSSDKLNENITYEIQYDEAMLAITELKKQLVCTMILLILMMAMSLTLRKC